MTDLSVIDRFMTAFIAYIDSGFGLLGGDVHFLTATLIGIDMTLAGLFWSLGGEDNVLGRFIRKILYVGAFAFILGNFAVLGDIVFHSFSQAGLTAGGGTLTSADLLKPGRLAATGFSAAWPLLQQAAKLVSITGLLDNFLVIIILLLAWLLVILAFFVLAVQIFVTILEFKLTSLAGFILVPFALWNRTAFLAERVLGNVVSSGIKVMVLAVLVGISSNFFEEFTASLKGQEPDIVQALSLVLASLALFGLGIFGPSIASGLVAGAPQLGAGAALGTGVGAAGIIALGAGGAAGAARLAGGAVIGAVRAGTSMGTAASTSWKMGQAASGSQRASAGLGGMARAASGAAKQKAKSAFGIGEAAERGRSAARAAFEDREGGQTSSEPPASAAPGWARDLRRKQDARHHRAIAVQTLKEGERGGASANPDIKEKED
jgi:type IV secretion system protein TrbL